MLVKTNLEGKKNLDVLESVIGQLSDGIWENSRVMEKYWKNAKIEESFNGEIYIVTKPYSVFETQNQTKEFFANKLKQIVKIEKNWSNSQIQWKRDCNIKLDYFHGDTTVADVYKVYDILLDRNIEKFSYAI